MDMSYSNMTDSEKVFIDQKSFMYVISYMPDKNAVKIACQHRKTYYRWICLLNNDLINDLINDSIELDKSNFHYKISPKTLFSLLNDFKQNALNPIYTFQFPEFENSAQPIVITLTTTLPNNEANDVKYISLQPDIYSDIERLTLKIEDCETQIKHLKIKDYETQIKQLREKHEQNKKIHEENKIINKAMKIVIGCLAKQVEEIKQAVNDLQKKDIDEDDDESDNEVLSNKRKSASKPKTAHQAFIASELKLQRKKNPGLKNEDYMMLAAIEWNKYKEKNGIVTGKKPAQKITAKKKKVEADESE